MIYQTVDSVTVGYRMPTDSSVFYKQFWLMRRLSS